jgi:hypothetical protein
VTGFPTPPGPICRDPFQTEARPTSTRSTTGSSHKKAAASLRLQKITPSLRLGAYRRPGHGRWNQVGLRLGSRTLAAHMPSCRTTCRRCKSDPARRVNETTWDRICGWQLGALGPRLLSRANRCSASTEYPRSLSPNSLPREANGNRRRYGYETPDGCGI